ncbi:hypothetical protein [Wenzhouxiangella sp. EGI_FJ10409]|uniref:hypothetical protein n=1 Tax=Wenzhouxiangella sp. EGI_FJ10409 TaxID=3243767 RepID=UPI0035E0C785
MHGADSFVGYYDYGVGMPRGDTFLVVPIPNPAQSSLVEILQATSPRKESLWREVELVGGDSSTDEPFEAVVPAKKRHPSPNSTIVEREAVLIRGGFKEACGKHYLVAVLANPLFSIEDEWPKLRESYTKFNSSLRWPD